ncbi:hypothetical protein PG995_008935 [Apiospora arundinis]|uniref:Uncharacterized protein n=1 Tax=Apiospora arundinis TaxID=335852 RepID=A0ABR2JMB7_9PEZI
MFTIGNVEKNRAFNDLGVPVDPTNPLYKELVAKYHHMRDPLVPMADDVVFHDFIRSKIMEKALRAKQNEEDEKNESAYPAQGNSSSSNNNEEEGGGSGDAVVPQKSTQEPKKKTGRSFKNYFRLYCF